MSPLLRDLLRPYRRTLSIILAMMLVQMAMSLAAPWPLKVILDNVAGNHPAPQWINWLLPMLGGTSKVHIAAAAGIVTVVIALLIGVAFYVATNLTEGLGQCIANDLRVRLYHHLQELSLAYYDNHRVGTLLSTLTGDVQTIQSFASMSTLNMVTDSLTIVAMVTVMFWLRWDFALIAIAVTPLLVIFVLRVNNAIRTAIRKCATPVRDALHPARGPASDRSVQAFSRQDLEEQQFEQASRPTVTAWIKARRLSSLLSPVVTIAIALCTGLVLWRGSLLILSGVMTVGALTVFLAYLAKFFQPVRELAVMTNTIAQVAVGFERVQASAMRTRSFPSAPPRLIRRRFEVKSPSSTWRSAMTLPCRCYATSAS